MSSLRTVLAVLVLPWVGVGCFRPEAPQPVLVGHVVPLSGADRSRGEHARQGVQLALAQAPVGLKEVAGRPIQFLHADSRGEEEAAQAEAVRLLTVNRVVALMAGPSTTLAERLVRTARAYETPTVVPGELPDVPPGEEALSLGAMPAFRGRVLAQYAARDLKAAHAVVLTDTRDPAAAQLASAFLKEWPRGPKYRAEEHPYARDADHAVAADQAVQARPDVLLLAGSVAGFHDLRSRVRGFELKVPILYGGEDVDASALGGEPGMGPGIYLTTVYSPQGLTDRGKEFARRYEERFQEPPDLTAAEAYDGACLLLDVLHRAQEVKADRIRQELANTATFQSVTGPVSWKERVPRRRVFVVRLGGGEARVVRTVEPGGE